MKQRRRVLYLQLSALDNDVNGAHENLPNAALYLDRALRESHERRFHEGVFLPASPPGTDQLGNAALAQAILELRPDVVACTLYLWNIERTIRLLRGLRRRMPGLRVIAGGPEGSFRHPFLFRSGVCDAVAVGEGEGVFPAVLGWCRGLSAPSCRNVALRTGSRYRWGRAPVPSVGLKSAVPPVTDVARRIPDRAIAYLETTRGCPMRCTYCRYHHLRAGVDSLAPAAVAAYVAEFRSHGFGEVRFVDPTFNCHPRFDAVLDRLVDVNEDRGLRFFAEIKGESVTPREAERMARAHFEEVEIGLQSVDPRVQRAIRRPTNLPALEQGIRRLTANGIRVTLDVMYGLPEQTAEDVYRSIEWARRLPGVRVQCMQTLLLPGTSLREHGSRWRVKAGARPPYGVTSTATLSEAEMRGIEEFIGESRDLPSDVPTSRFVGWRLPDLFPERLPVAANAIAPAMPIPGRTARRVLIVGGRDLFARSAAIVGLVKRAMREEPDALWQFVMAPETEEPLDLLDRLVAAIREGPAHILDRYSGSALTRRIASRRVFIQLRRGNRYDPSWEAAAEDLLRRHFN